MSQTLRRAEPPGSAEEGGRINMGGVRVLILQRSEAGNEALTGVLRGFGTRDLTTCGSVREAKVRSTGQRFDLVFCDSELEDDEGLQFVRWLRRDSLSGNEMTPVIMLLAHTSGRKVAAARDCGGNFVIAKPVAPKVLLDRIRWIANDNRMFVESEGYVGPDRRVKARFPNPGRRAGDDAEPENAGELLSQDGIDAMFD